MGINPPEMSNGEQRSNGFIPSYKYITSGKYDLYKDGEKVTEIEI